MWRAETASGTGRMKTGATLREGQPAINLYPLPRLSRD
jgi:hypothetical protein